MSAQKQPPEESTTYEQFIWRLKASMPCARVNKQRRVILCGRCECRQVLDVLRAHDVGHDDVQWETLTDWGPGSDGQLDGVAGQLARQVHQAWLNDEWE